MSDIGEGLFKGLATWFVESSGFGFRVVKDVLILGNGDINNKKELF